ncbi:peptidase S53 [Burkholderia singularis]|uniref:Peptidase S53 n=1 Tax=Burkholderia singularis TaxID=1503053 RepID=A0A103E5P2_9BURK|nr:S53 family peptidase [Burkholderia singularis]KVE28856.1 peptidase S53 [Burkholderia singularis]
MQRTQHVNPLFPKRFALSLLPLAIAATLAPLSVQAASAWAPTHTDAFLLTRTSATTAASQTQAKTAPSYALNTIGTPELTDTTVTPLELSQPLRVTVVLKNRNEAQLDAFLSEVNKPGSANYHKFLTPEQFKARFGPTDAQVQAVVAHLKANGFSNVSVSDNNKLVFAEGNASNAERGFHTTLKRFSYRGKQVYGNDSAAQVPAALGTVVDAVLGLQNAAVPHRMLRRVASPDSVVRNAVAGSQIGHQPTDFASIYDAKGLPAATNTTVGIITWGDQTQTIADLNQFTQSAGLATVNTKVVPGGSGTLANDGDPSEWDLDSQTIIGTSGGVKQLIFYSAINGDSHNSALTDASITAAYNKAVTDNVAKVINVSLGLDEAAANSDGSLAADDAVFKQAVAQGQIFSVSSGDSGVYQWSSAPYSGAPGYVGTESSSGAITVRINLGKYSVSHPASSPNVVAVGGTTLSTSGTTTWAGETVWNEGLSYADQVTNQVRLWATGGGVSAYETAPSWQTAALGSTVTKRVLPDVAFDAAGATGAYIIINGQPNQLIGGTSLASPIFVGGWARVESANGNSLGLPTSAFYAGLPSNPSLVHDVTSGNNGYNGYGYSAKTGWDYDTGFGSLDFAKVSASSVK